LHFVLRVSAMQSQLSCTPVFYYRLRAVNGKKYQSTKKCKNKEIHPDFLAKNYLTTHPEANYELRQ
jgi:hypothetical protein